LSEDQIASLDGDWTEHTPAQRAAYAFTRKLTYEPHRLGDADIVELRKHYNDKQILGIILHVAGYNSTNRWKEGAGIPQSSGGGNFGSRRPEVATARTEKAAEKPAEKPAEKTERPVERSHNYLTPTSPKFQNVITKVVPLLIDQKTGKPSTETVFQRAPLESRAVVEKALAAARTRSPRLPLVDEAKSRTVVPEGVPAGALPQWMRLLATFPNTGKDRLSRIYSAETQGDLKPLLKAQVSWIIARQDRAWYALGEAQRRLRDLGWTDDQIFKLDGDWSEFTPSERAQFRLARQLAAAPIMLTDAETTDAVKLVGPRDVVQLISYTTNRASFNRITEAAGLTTE
jgi:alkylhydroperoxidase family enzyme